MENKIKLTSKISVEQITEVKVPVYFKHLANYYMVLDHSTYLVVKDLGKEHFKNVGLYPSISQESISDYVLSKSGEFEPITEDLFKEVFTKVSLELEALMN